MREQLLAIDGVGEATADAILEVIEEETTEEENKWLDKAYSALEEGDESRALVYLKRSQ